MSAGSGVRHQSAVERLARPEIRRFGYSRECGAPCWSATSFSKGERPELRHHRCERPTRRRRLAAHPHRRRVVGATLKAGEIAEYARSVQDASGAAALASSAALNPSTRGELRRHADVLQEPSAEVTRRQICGPGQVVDRRQASRPAQPLGGGSDHIRACERRPRQERSVHQPCAAVKGCLRRPIGRAGHGRRPARRGAPRPLRCSLGQAWTRRRGCAARWDAGEP